MQYSGCSLMSIDYRRKILSLYLLYVLTPIQPIMLLNSLPSGLTAGPSCCPPRASSNRAVLRQTTDMS